MQSGLARTALQPAAAAVASTASPCYSRRLQSQSACTPASFYGRQPAALRALTLALVGRMCAVECVCVCVCVCGGGGGHSGARRLHCAGQRTCNGNGKAPATAAAAAATLVAFPIGSAASPSRLLARCRHYCRRCRRRRCYYYCVRPSIRPSAVPSARPFAVEILGLASSSSSSSRPSQPTSYRRALIVQRANEPANERTNENSQLSHRNCKLHSKQ